MRLVVEERARYYAGVTEGGRQIVIGAVLTPALPFGWPAGIHIVSELYPLGFNGLRGSLDSFHMGCRIVTTRYDPSSKEILSRCSSTGGGTRF